MHLLIGRTVADELWSVLESSACDSAKDDPAAQTYRKIAHGRKTSAGVTIDADASDLAELWNRLDDDIESYTDLIKSACNGGDERRHYQARKAAALNLRKKIEPHVFLVSEVVMGRVVNRSPAHSPC